MFIKKNLKTAGTVGIILASLWIAAKPLIAQKASGKDLGGPERYLTHLSTDKPIYRTGEIVYVRGVILNAKDHSPLAMPTASESVRRRAEWAASQVNAMVEIKGPKGDTVASGWTQDQNSVIGFTWKVPDGQAGGEYTVKVSYPWHGHAPVERKFDIRAYRAPRLKSQIVFLRDGYGPGDTVGASLHVDRAEGGVPANAKVTILARVDGGEVSNIASKVDSAGNCSASFKLPAQIARGEGTLAFIIEDGGIVETASKTIPILLQTIDLTLYPEGGELVAGLPNRIYFEAKTPAKKPADISGVVLDGEKTVGEFRTEHEGRGRFELTPTKGGKYALRITRPTGIKTVYALPEIKETGAVLSAAENATEKGKAVKLKVAAANAGKLTVTLSKREVEVASTIIEAKAGKVEAVLLTPPADADGVLIATLWAEAGKPLAERLIYRKPVNALNISVATDKTGYVPGDGVKLTVKATDEKGKPVSAVVGVTVTDDSVLEMIEKREQAPRLPVMVFLENEVSELGDAHVYLDAENEKAPSAVDLLLGTQGWRRFSFMDAPKFIAAHGDKARRVLALRLPSPPGRGMERKLADGFALRAKEDAPQPCLADMPDITPIAEKGEKLDPCDKPLDMNKAIAMADAKQEELGFALKDAEAMEAPAVIIGGRLRRQAVCFVREFAYQVRSNRKPGDRVDFTETLYWNAGVKTDETTGEATMTFALNDAVTAFRVFADGFSLNGALGQGTGIIESTQPFYIEPKLPLEVTAGDVLKLPVGVVNGTNGALANATLTVDVGGNAKVSTLGTFNLSAKERARRIVEIAVGNGVGISDFVVAAQAGTYSDKVTRKFTVKPQGFPKEIACGGLLGPGENIAHEIEVPEELVPGSLTAAISVYPTPLANLTDALERLIREPCGCFEQTSSSNYPLVMAQQYFLTHQGVPPAMIQRSREMLDKGYARLVSFECKQNGYEWFGGDPGHEALTAYGLMQFNDMAQVRDMDAAMVGRTRDWLLKRRDNKGGFERNSRALDSFGGAPADVTNAYIVWALLESGEKDLEKEVAAVIAAAGKDPYVAALTANTAFLAGDKASSKKLMDFLSEKQTAEGSVGGAVAGITGSGGEALNIETTSLAVLAWLREPAYAGQVEKGMKWLAESCKAGRFGSTQSTILALRAIVAYDKSRAHPKAPGSLQLFLNGNAVGAPVSFSAETQGAVMLPEISDKLQTGPNKIEVKMAGGSKMPYSIAVKFNDLKPATSPTCKIELQTTLTEEKVSEGAVTEVKVKVVNLMQEILPTPVAIIGLPGGLEPRHDQLKELVKSGKIAAYEVIGREVVLYWRGLKEKQEVSFPISVTAAIPGTYTGPACRAYLYYTDEHKYWVDGLKIRIEPRKGTR